LLVPSVSFNARTHEAVGSDGNNDTGTVNVSVLKKSTSSHDWLRFPIAVSLWLLRLQDSVRRLFPACLMSIVADRIDPASGAKASVCDHCGAAASE
jgi:hypothetical protein